ncbi:DsbA family protein [Thiobacillus sp. 65-1402]|uniref:DsbA family protein n=1 Tax=Thiobacillus sp. 65-1402 TaxID=1895861 RepID=UPI000964777F|nr:DsbA family protein [Thiobacillus sp. 65-1402]OJW74851.1 MAG: protein-disulfide isomerase [Thiobacillus sp. 65-1402]
MTPPLLWYFADPMCSWCWGFSPVIESLRDDYRERMKIALVLGGLRPGTTAPMTAADREEILHHWRQVHERTGQPLCFEHALPEGFIYDTEPASRAVVTAGILDPALIFAMFKAIQTAFYAGGHDVTRPGVLAELAAGLGMDAQEFLRTFDSDEVRAVTRAHFRQARQAGVRGFPALILQQGTQLHPIGNGWQPLDAVRAAIEARLAA